AARLMRSARFRDCFPQSYVRRWAEEFRTHILRQHLAQLPLRRDKAMRIAVECATRNANSLRQIERSPVLGLPLRWFPRLGRHLEHALANLQRQGVERRLRREERQLYWLLDPSLRIASLARRLCESVRLLPKRFPPVAPIDMVPNGGHGFRVDLG